MFSFCNANYFFKAKLSSLSGIKNRHVSWFRRLYWVAETRLASLQKLLPSCQGFSLRLPLAHLGNQHATKLHHATPGRSHKSGFNSCACQAGSRWDCERNYGPGPYNVDGVTKTCEEIRNARPSEPQQHAKMVDGVKWSTGASSLDAIRNKVGTLNFVLS